MCEKAPAAVSYYHCRTCPICTPRELYTSSPPLSGLWVLIDTRPLRQIFTLIRYSSSNPSQPLLSINGRPPPAQPLSNQSHFSPTSATAIISFNTLSDQHQSAIALITTAISFGTPSLVAIIIVFITLITETEKSKPGTRPHQRKLSRLRWHVVRCRLPENVVSGLRGCAVTGGEVAGIALEVLASLLAGRIGVD